MVTSPSGFSSGFSSGFGAPTLAWESTLHESTSASEGVFFVATWDGSDPADAVEAAEGTAITLSTFSAPGDDCEIAESATWVQDHGAEATEDSCEVAESVTWTNVLNLSVEDNVEMCEIAAKSALRQGPFFQIKVYP